jgi:hypothetical protein
MSARSAPEKPGIAGFAIASHEGIEPMKSVIRSDPFTFVVNGSRFETDVMNAVLISPAVHSQLLHDQSVESFVISDEFVRVADVWALKDVVTGGCIRESMAARRSLLSICRPLQHHRVEKIVFARSIGISSRRAVNILEAEDSILGIAASKVYLCSDSDV